MDEGVYRTPGRESDPRPPPPPSLRTLSMPLAYGVAALAILLVPLLLFNAVFDPDAANGYREVRLVPWLDTAETVAALLMLATEIVVVLRVVMRVVPSWAGLRRWQQAVYVAAVLAAQTCFVAGAEVALFQSRGGLHILEPSLRASYGPTEDSLGSRAYVFSHGLGCGYDLFVSEPLSPTMHRVQRVAGHCSEPPPRARWQGSSVWMVDADGVPLEDQPSKWVFPWPGGC